MTVLLLNSFVRMIWNQTDQTDDCFIINSLSTSSVFSWRYCHEPECV